jgi:hypothetical protein
MNLKNMIAKAEGQQGAKIAPWTDRIHALRAQIDSMNLPETRRQAAEDVMHFLSSERYASMELLEAIQVNDKGEIGLLIPQEHFFGENPGFFQLRAAWPQVGVDGVARCQVTINYRVDGNGHNVLLQPGMGTGERTGWSDLNSSACAVQELIEFGYIDQASVGQFLSFVSSKVGAKEKTTLTLTPQSDVFVTLRATIVPKEPSSDNGRNIVTDKAAGELANLGIASIEFQGATILKLNSPLVGKSSTPLISMGELMAKYGQRPVATPVHSTIVGGV